MNSAPPFFAPHTKNYSQLHKPGHKLALKMPPVGLADKMHPVGLADKMHPAGLADILPWLIRGFERASLLEIGLNSPFGPALKTAGYVGLDKENAPVMAAKRHYPNLSFRVQNDALPKADLVLALNGALDDAQSQQDYDQHLNAIAQSTQKRLIIKGYDYAVPDRDFYGPLSSRLEATGLFQAAIPIQTNGAEVILLLDRLTANQTPPSKEHNMLLRDAFALSGRPAFLQYMIDLASGVFGFFSRDFLRTFELIFALEQSGPHVERRLALDLGSGLSPWPLLLAELGAQVTTVDNHPFIATADNRSEWRHEGFFDYEPYNMRCRSLHTSIFNAPTGSYDLISAFRLFQDLTSHERRLFWPKLHSFLAPKGRLLLSIPLEKRRLNFANSRAPLPSKTALAETPPAEAPLAEAPEKDILAHLPALKAELEEAGFTLQLERHHSYIPHSTADIWLACLTRKSA